MLRSMTGFGSATGLVEGVEYAIEVRSVNNRYLKSHIKLPEGLFEIESRIEALLRERVRRGSVTMTVRMSFRDERAAPRVNASVLSSYLAQLRPLAEADRELVRIDLGAILALPGVCEPPSSQELLAATGDGLLTLATEAFDRLVAMREKEGRQVEDDLLANCAEVERHLAVVAEAAPKVVLDYQQRLNQRVAELTGAGETPLDGEALAREVAFFAERSDVAEEITRLTGHIEQFRQSVSSQAPTGRKLDFIAQEMLREANTIASKANSGAVARSIVAIKTAIDRIKEQVQNVE